MKRHVLLRRLQQFDAKLTATITGEKKPTREFAGAVFRGAGTFGLAGGLGALAGEAASKKKHIWVDQNGNPTSEPVVKPLVGAGVGVGGVLAHKAIMDNYGGADAGVVGAYQNAGRNAVQGAKDFLSGRVAAAQAGAASGAATGRAVGEAIGTKAGAAVGNATQDLKNAGMEGLDAIKKKLAGLKGKIGPFMSKIGFEAVEGRLVQFDQTIEEIVAEKKADKLKRGKAETGFAYSDSMPTAQPPQKKKRPLLKATAGALATAGAVKAIRSPLGRGIRAAVKAQGGFRGMGRRLATVK